MDERLFVFDPCQSASRQRFLSQQVSTIESHILRITHGASVFHLARNKNVNIFCKTQTSETGIPTGSGRAIWATEYTLPKTETKFPIGPVRKDCYLHNLAVRRSD